MATSAQLAEWRTCPRCGSTLEHEERSVHCPSCGLEEYGNPAPTASAVIRDDEGRILLGRRARDPGAGLWDLLGGFLDEGEEPVEALRRELREETGLEIEPGEFLGGLPDRYGEEGNWTVNLYWEARLGAGEPEPADDVAEIAWFPRRRAAASGGIRLRQHGRAPRAGRSRLLLACSARCSRSPPASAGASATSSAGFAPSGCPCSPCWWSPRPPGVTGIALVVAIRADGPPAARYVGYAALAGICGAVGLTALYRGLAVGPMSVVAPISATAAVIPVVFGIVAGERPSALQGAGIALAVVGVVLASRARGVDGGRGTMAEGVGLALVAAVAFGLLLVALGEASEGDALWGTLSMRTTSFGLLVLAALLLRPSFALAERDLAVLLLIGVLDTLGNALFAVATTKTLLSLVAVLGQLYPVVTVLLARVLLGERLSTGQGAGVVSAFGGVVLITAG